MKKIMRIFNLIKRELFAKHCSVCGRLLMTEESRRLGIGPECLRQSPAKQRELLEQEGQQSFQIGELGGETNRPSNDGATVRATKAAQD